MPPFNPNVPDVNPANTAFWARPIEQPKADISKETLYKGIGQSFDEAVSGVDDFIKHGVIQPIEEKDIGTRRNEYADALNSARDYVNRQYTAGDKPTLMPSGENVPSAVAQSGDKMQMLQDSMNGGHLSETKYYGDLDNYLRRLRTMFPGYRDFIDEEAHRITGVNPANAQIRSAISDLNRMLAEHQGRKDEMTQLLDWASKSGDLDPDTFRSFQEAYAKNPGDTGLVFKLREAINNRQQWKTNDAKNKAEWEQNEHDRKTADEKAKTGLNEHFSGERDMFLDHAMISSGLWKNANLKSWLTDLGNGTIDINDPQFSASIALTANQLQTKRDQYLAAWTQYAMRTYPGYGGSGDQSVASLIKTNLEPIDDMIKHLKDKEAGWFTVTADMTKGMRADAEHNLEQQFGKQRAALKYIKDFGGEAFIPQGMYADIGALDQKIYKSDWLNAHAQPGLQPGGDGQVMTLNKAIEDWKKKGATKENFDTLLGWRDLLVNKDASPEIKSNLVKFFYSVPNWENFRKYTWGDPGGVYNRLFNELVSKNISKLPSENYQMYRGAAEAEGGTLFGSNMVTLRGFERGGAGDSKFQWHTEPFMQKNGKLGMLEVLGARVPPTLQTAVNNLNDLFMGIKSVYAHDPSHKGTPVEEFVANFMEENGVDPIKNINGMPEKIVQAIMAARGGAKKPVTPGEETGKVRTIEEQ